ncbi:DUF1570 domain-containing protein [Tundrisphaera sp. TA3]|uniref:DUF1570 domain-containing protein n=1 Tax=Tundrisphaera sp. TA3 TaxID=3435775 RepID=UPI003EBE7730
MRKRRSLPRLAGYLFLLAFLPGCATMGDRGKPLVPTEFQTRTGPFAVFTGTQLAADAPVVRQLQSLETEVRETLGLRVDPATEPIEVYILEDRQSFQHFLSFHYPDLPHRRAFFLANGPRRVVYTCFGDRLIEDIRHEGTHALLHAAVGDIPLWLDEGLAEYFEGPADRKGLNPEHVGRLPADLAAGWAPDLARLETQRSVRQMTPRDYRESWAWVHFLLNDERPRKAALLAYLADLRSSPDCPPLTKRLEGPSDADMLAHLAEAQKAPIAAAPPASDAPRDPTVRLQSASIESAPPPLPTKRRGFFSRLFGGE